MIVRDLDASRVNVVINNPDVRPWVEQAPDGALDLTPLVENPANVLLMLEDGTGGALFVQHEPGVYEAHLQFLPISRGRIAMEAVREMQEFMFTRTDCMEMLCGISAANRPAIAFTRAMGGREEFRRLKAWRGPDDGRCFALRYPEWVRSAHGLPEYGRSFRDGEGEEPQDRPAGAFLATLLGGQPAKAVTLFNRWARIARFETAKVESLDPLVIDFQSARLAIDVDGLKVL